MNSRSACSWVALALVAGVSSCRLGPTPRPDGIVERTIETATLRFAALERGDGPLVLMLHGFPALAEIWRAQIVALSEQGFHVVAPDMRGYGGTDAPESAMAYDMIEVAGDVVAILDALGEDRAILVGHDFGAFAAWSAVLLHPSRFTHLVAMSVPYTGRGQEPPVAAMRRAAGDNFSYVVYYQDVGVAEAEFDPDPRALFERVFVSPQQAVEPPSITSPLAAAGGMLGRLPRANELPPWFTESDMEHWVTTFERTGFRGGLNYYRALDRTFERSAHVADARIEIPVLFLAGAADPVLLGLTSTQLEAAMAPVVPDLSVHVFDDVGHWVQRERAAAVNTAILEFLPKP